MLLADLKKERKKERKKVWKKSEIKDSGKKERKNIVYIRRPVPRILHICGGVGIH